MKYVEFGKTVNRIIQGENHWYQNVETDVVKAPVDSLSIDEEVQVLKEIKIGKAPEPSDVSSELNDVCGDLGI